MNIRSQVYNSIEFIIEKIERELQLESVRLLLRNAMQLHAWSSLCNFRQIPKRQLASVDAVSSSTLSHISCAHCEENWN